MELFNNLFNSIFFYSVALFIGLFLIRYVGELVSCGFGYKSLKFTFIISIVIFIALVGGMILLLINDKPITPLLLSCFWGFYAGYLLKTFPVDTTSVVYSKQHDAIIKINGDDVEIKGGQLSLFDPIFCKLSGGADHQESTFKTNPTSIVITNTNNQLTYALADKLLFGFKKMELFIETDDTHAKRLTQFESPDGKIKGAEAAQIALQEMAIDTLGVKVSVKKTEEIYTAEKIKTLIEAEDVSNGQLSLAQMINIELDKVDLKYYRIKHVRITEGIPDAEWLKASAKKLLNKLNNDADAEMLKGALTNAQTIKPEDIEKMEIYLAAKGQSKAYYGLKGTGVIVSEEKKN